VADGIDYLVSAGIADRERVGWEGVRMADTLLRGLPHTTRATYGPW